MNIHLAISDSCCRPLVICHWALLIPPSCLASVFFALLAPLRGRSSVFRQSYIVIRKSYIPPCVSPPPNGSSLLPALVALGWRAPVLRLREPLRALALLALVLALAEPQARVGNSGLDLWVLVDRSDSIAAAAAAQGPEISTILERSKPGADRIFYIDFAVDACRRDEGDPDLPGGTGQTRTGNALDLALGQLFPDRSARFLVLTDGYATEPLGNVAEKILRSGVPLDYRILGQGSVEDYRIDAVEGPGARAARRIVPRRISRSSAPTMWRCHGKWRATERSRCAAPPNCTTAARRCA